MQRQTDLSRLVAEALARRLHAAHDELEVREVVASSGPIIKKSRWLSERPCNPCEP